MAEQSTALHAYSTGQPCFFPSKRIANQTNSYRFGLNELADGSIYCYPIKIKTKNREMAFVITFATYGTCLCDEFHTSDGDAFSLIFREFSRRIELELVLWTIKGFKKPTSSTKLKNQSKVKK